jgi:hypothetical protein
MDAIWRRILEGADEKAWVVFHHGTCVVVTEPTDDVASAAAALLAEYGPVIAGTPSGDFTVIHLNDHPGWVVVGHHHDILNYVAPEDVIEGAPEHAIGLYGRSLRALDADKLLVAYEHVPAR